MSDRGAEAPPRELGDLQVSLGLDEPARAVVEGWRDWYAAHNEAGEVIFGDHVDACNEYLAPGYLDLLTT